VALAGDWDGLAFCGVTGSDGRPKTSTPWGDWSAEIQAFVAEQGKGLLAIMDYGVGQIDAEFRAMNKITAPAGITFEPLNNLEYASMDVNVDCVADLR